MKFLLTIVFILNVHLVWGQKFSYPVIKKQGRTISDFIPEGWKLLAFAEGNLNNDSYKDFAFIIQHKDSVTIVNSYEDSVLTQPRILLITFADKPANRLLLVEQNNSFILNHDNSEMEDPFQSISIINKILQIDFQLFYNMGSWYITNTSYKFRCQGNTFVLIGAENNSFHRATQDFENYSYNFLTKKWSLTKGNDNSDQKSKATWKNLDLKKLKTLKTFKQPYTWEVTKDTYL